MSKSKVRFAEDAVQAKRRRVNENDEEERDETAGPNKKHTLDSDEEDEGANYQKLDIKNVEGQEDATDEYDGGMKIMAFNMKDDMEEGHFDKDGTFIYNKKDTTIKDAWLDNINWENVKNSAGKHWIPQEKEPDDAENDEGDATTSVNKKNLDTVYNRLLELINDKETVAAALKRLNSEKGLSAAEERKRRWAAKKAGTKLEDNQSPIVSEITTLADGLISLGHMGAYQLDSSRIKELLAKLNSTEHSKENNTESAFDMFGDESLPAPSTPTGAVKESSPDVQSLTMWEFKMKGEEKLQGPVSTEAISNMQEKGDFEKGASARRVGTEAFYDVKRIDLIYMSRSIIFKFLTQSIPLEMQLSESTKKVVVHSANVFRFGIQWGFVPLIVYLGFRHGPEVAPNGEKIPLTFATFVISKLTPSICRPLYGDGYENCVFSTREHELLVFLGAVIVWKNRKSTNWWHYVSTVYLYTKFVNAFLFFISNALYGILYILVALVFYIVLPEPLIIDSEKIRYFQGSTFQQELEKDKSVTYIIEFFTTWSSECKYLGPVFSALSEKYTLPNLKFGKFDVGKYAKEGEQQFRINTHPMSKQIPSIAIFKEGKQVDRRPMVANSKAIPFVFSEENCIREFDLNNLYAECKSKLKKFEKKIEKTHEQ
uniref:Mitochondrial import receptor subunit TOM7 homolog n=1 Tax=Ditylenchus dipsaci TaxID=166011 RepID=A0A915EHY3_9BILA